MRAVPGGAAAPVSTDDPLQALRERCPEWPDRRASSANAASRRSAPSMGVFGASGENSECAGCYAATFPLGSLAISLAPLR